MVARGGVSAANATAKRSKRWVWLLVVIVAVAWATAVALLALRVDRHVRDGVAAVSVAQTKLNATTISDPHSPDVLAPVVADFGAARRDLDNPLLWPARFLPVAGRQVRAIRNLAAAAEQVGSIGETAIGQARAALQAPHHTGPQRVAAISELAAAAAQADARLSKVSLGPHTALVGFVRHRYDDFAARFDKVRSGVHKGAVAAQQTAVLLQGPSHLLLLAANNAEMRNGSGMFLSATQVEIDAGKVTIGAVSDTTDLALPHSPVPLAAGYAAVWGPYLANEEWRNLGMSARFDETAAMAAAMWKAKTGNDVGGVMALDISGLQSLLVGTGPVDAGGTTVTADNVVQLLMHDQYVGVSTTDASDQVRKQQLGRIAASVVGAVQRGQFDTAAMAKQLPTTAGGRHLMLWSADPTTEAAWQAAGVAGVLADDTLLAAVQNRGGNKLDQFLTVSTTVRVHTGPRHAGDGDVASRQPHPAGSAALHRRHRRRRPARHLPRPRHAHDAGRRHWSPRRREGPGQRQRARRPDPRRRRAAVGTAWWERGRGHDVHGARPARAPAGRIGGPPALGDPLRPDTDRVVHRW